jgi:hypothetical protein
LKKLYRTEKLSSKMKEIIRVPHTLEMRERLVKSRANPSLLNMARLDESVCDYMQSNEMPEPEELIVLGECKL